MEPQIQILPNCHSAFAKKSQKTANINRVKQNQTMVVILPLLQHTDHLSCSQRCYLPTIHATNSPKNFPCNVIYIFKKSFMSGRRKPNKKGNINTSVKNNKVPIVAFLCEEFFFYLACLVDGSHGLCLFLL